MKNHSKYKQLEDEGWLSMQKSLDLHMPIKKNRRLVLWFFLSLPPFIILLLYYNCSLINKRKDIWQSMR